jgi:hypothetical protein
MFQKLKDHCSRLWQGRFRYGFEFIPATFVINRFENNEFRVVCGLGMLLSSGTGHWPLVLAEFGAQTGSRRSWHVGLLGLTIGRCWLSQFEVMESGEKEVRPDICKLYFFFKCLNHQAQSVEEII